MELSKLEIKTFAEGRDLVLQCRMSAAPEELYRAWTDPDLLVHWFTPLPWTTASAELDVRTGGSSKIVMRSPEGTEFPMHGKYLEVQPNKRLVFTDAYTGDWEPMESPFMTFFISFEEEGDKTLYTARVKHWTEEARKKHEEMGFHEGWPICTQQLAHVLEENKK